MFGTRPVSSPASTSPSPRSRSKRVRGKASFRHTSPERSPPKTTRTAEHRRPRNRGRSTSPQPAPPRNSRYRNARRESLERQHARLTQGVGKPSQQAALLSSATAEPQHALHHVAIVGPFSASRTRVSPEPAVVTTAARTQQPEEAKPLAHPPRPEFNATPHDSNGEAAAAVVSSSSGRPATPADDSTGVPPVRTRRSVTSVSGWGTQSTGAARSTRHGPPSVTCGQWPAGASFDGPDVAFRARASSRVLASQGAGISIGSRASHGLVIADEYLSVSGSPMRVAASPSKGVHAANLRHR